VFLPSLLGLAVLSENGRSIIRFGTVPLSVLFVELKTNKRCAVLKTSKKPQLRITTETN
jgi:hypothetical protein